MMEVCVLCNIKKHNLIVTYVYLYYFVGFSRLEYNCVHLFQPDVTFVSS